MQKGAVTEQLKMFEQSEIDRLKAIEKAARIFLKSHHGHHPVNCIDGCDESYGESILIEALLET